MDRKVRSLQACFRADFGLDKFYKNGALELDHQGQNPGNDQDHGYDREHDPLDILPALISIDSTLLLLCVVVHSFPVCFHYTMEWAKLWPNSSNSFTISSERPSA